MTDTFPESISCAYNDASRFVPVHRNGYRWRLDQTAIQYAGSVSLLGLALPRCRNRWQTAKPLIQCLSGRVIGSLWQR